MYNQGAGEIKFNTERQFDLGLNVDQSKYRTYDYTIGRWWQIDPKADSLESFTTYNYSFNNPIRYNDPMGDCPPDDPDCGGRGMSPTKAALQSNVGSNFRSAGNSASKILSASVGVQAVGLGATVKIGGLVGVEASGKVGQGEVTYSNTDGLGATVAVASTEIGATLWGFGGTATSTNMSYDGETAKLMDQSATSVVNELSLGVTLVNLSAEVSANLDAVGETINAAADAVQAFFQNLLPNPLGQ